MPPARRDPLANRRPGEQVALASASQLQPIRLKYDYEAIAAANRKTVIDAAAEIKGHETRARESMLRIGQKLSNVKALLPHGQFSDWCQIEFDMSQRTAQNMMRAAEEFAGKNETVSLLSDTAMYLLSGPSVPPEVRAEIIEEAKATGQSPTKARVQAAIKKHTFTEQADKLVHWLIDKGWSFSSDPGDTPRTTSKPGFPSQSWPKGDEQARYEALRTAEKYERGQLSIEAPPSQPTGSPIARILTYDETIAVIWRLIKHECQGDQRPEMLKIILTDHHRIKDYKHLLTTDVALTDETFAAAWRTVSNEINGRIEQAKNRANRDTTPAAAEMVIPPQTTLPTEPLTVELPALLAIYEAALQNIPACQQLLGERVSNTISFQLATLLDRLRELAEV